MTFDPNSFEGIVVRKLATIEQKVQCVDDHERRLRWLERIAYGAWGAVAVVGAWLKYHIASSK